MQDKITQNRLLISLLFGVSLLILLTIGFISYNITQLWINNRQKVASLRESLFLYERLFSLLKDAETTQRGYILTGDSTYMRPYQASIDTIQNYQQTVLKMPLNAEDKSKAATINKQVDSKLNELKRTLDIR